MKNSEIYKTAQERSTAFREYCNEAQSYTGDCNGCHIKIMNSGNNCAFDWIELEANTETPDRCFYCGYSTEVVPMRNGITFAVKCTNELCGYQSGSDNRHDAIAAHNRVAMAVQHEKMARDVLNATCDRHARGMTCEECVNVNCPSCPIVEQKGQQA